MILGKPKNRLPRVGWSLVILLLVVFVWGLRHRARLEMSGQKAVQMLFVPSVEQGTLVRRGDELARFIRADSGLTLRSQVPTSYAAVIQALARLLPRVRSRLPGRRALRDQPLRFRGAGRPSIRRDGECSFHSLWRLGG